MLYAELPRGLFGCDAEFAALADTLEKPLFTDDRRVRTACPGLALTTDTLGGGLPDADGR